MKLKTDDPFVPEDIRAKINGLQSLLDHAADLYSDISVSYTHLAPLSAAGQNHV